MAIRALQIPQDADTIVELVTESFQYPENPEWGVQEDEKENIAVLRFNSNALKEIDATSFIIEGYRNKDLSENFSYYQYTFCEPCWDNKSICKTDLSFSNKLDKEFSIRDKNIENYKERGFNPDKCEFGNVNGTYSGKEIIPFVLDCKEKTSCEVYDSC